MQTKTSQRKKEQQQATQAKKRQRLTTPADAHSAQGLDRRRDVLKVLLAGLLPQLHGGFSL